MTGQLVQLTMAYGGYRFILLPFVGLTGPQSLAQNVGPRCLGASIRDNFSHLDICHSETGLLNSQACYGPQKFQLFY